MLRRSIALFISLGLVGCATVRNGPMERIRVASSPSNAEVTLRNCGLWSTKKATTPAVVWVSRRSTQCRIVLDDGPGEASVRLSRHVSRGMNGYPETVGVWCGDESKNCNSAGDVIGVGLFSIVMFVPGLVVDFATGSMFELRPSDVSLDRAAREK